MNVGHNLRGYIAATCNDDDVGTTQASNRFAQESTRQHVIKPKRTRCIDQHNVEVAGAVKVIAPPPSVEFAELENNTTIFAFIEQENYPIPTDVQVDITEPGLYASNYRSTSEQLPAGTAVDCWLLQFNSVGRQSARVSGSITFSSEILGIIVTKGGLDATDGPLGRSGTAYCTGQDARGMESPVDRIMLYEDRRTVTIPQFETAHRGDQVRIIVMPAP